MTLVRRNRNGFYPAFNTIWNDFFNDRLFDTPTANTSLPAVNVKENDESFSLEVAAPGLKKEDFHVRVDNDILTISTESENKTEEKDEKGNYTRREFSYRSFKRSFTLPESVDGDNINAKYEDGVLYVSLPKREEAKVKPARMIEIA